jgi:signal transduction histidine kinase
MGRKSAVLTRAERIPPPEPLADFSGPLDEVETPEAEAEEAADDGLEAEVAVTDNVGEQSIEINVESLIAELEAESQHDKAPDIQCARRKLEDYLERKRIARELEDFEDFVVED